MGVGGRGNMLSNLKFLLTSNELFPGNLLICTYMYFEVVIPAG